MASIGLPRRQLACPCLKSSSPTGAGRIWLPGCPAARLDVWEPSPEPETCEANLTFPGKIRHNAVMRLRRFVIACLVSLGVSLQGVAGVLAVETPCPMMQAAAGSADSATMASDMSHDCCNDAATFAKTGKPCKTDLSCQTVSQAPLSGYAITLFAPTAEPVVPFRDRAVRAHDPSPVWRPPALI
jgi:hypothetical protein